MLIIYRFLLMRKDKIKQKFWGICLVFFYFPLLSLCDLLEWQSLLINKCLLLYSICASLQHLLIIWFIVSLLIGYTWFLLSLISYSFYSIRSYGILVGSVINSDSDSFFLCITRSRSYSAQFPELTILLFFILFLFSQVNNFHIPVCLGVVFVVTVLGCYN